MPTARVDAGAGEDEGEIYVADLIGMRVVHVDGRELGVVKAVQNFGAGELIEVQPAAGPDLPAALHRGDLPGDRHRRPACCAPIAG